MNLRTFLIAGTSALFCVFLVVMSISTTTAQVQSPEGTQLIRPDLINDVQERGRAGGAANNRDPVGRFQGAVNQDTLYLFDTMTGECWRAVPGNGWKEAVPPILAPTRDRH